MYHTTFSPQAMVHVVGNYGANGQFMPLQNHPFYINSPNHVNQFHQISRNVSNYNRNRMVQSGSYASDLYLMDAENSPNRSMFNVHNKFPSSNWQRQISSPSSNASLSPSVSHMNYRSNILRKNQSWNNINKNTKKNSYQDLTSLNETCNSSDSSLGSRSPTPNNYFKDANQTESSDDRESVHSLSDQSFKSARNNSNCTIRGGLVSSSSSQSLYSNQRNVYNYQDNISRSQIHHNYQNKRRYQNTRNSPPRTHRNRKFPGALVLGNYIYPQLYYSAPDRFLHKAHLIEVKEKPKNLLNNSTYDKLSKAIWDKFEQNQQTEVTFCNKINLWKYLLIFIRSKFPQYGLFMVGSTLNGFGSNSSDIDMCLLLRNAEMDQKNEAIFRLEQILRCLKKCEFIEQLELIQAKVPILKFHNSTFNLDIDLNCNNAVGIRNTHLLYCYSRIDWRVRPLALVIKMWAQSQDINDAKNMTISSYSIALMVIHFLQCGVNPIILPCLHKIFQGKFDPLSDVHTIDVHEELNIPNNIFQCRNQQSLGELLIEFFKYYDKFDYDQYAISIRLAKKIPIEECRLVRTYKNDPHQWKYLCIEEPFDFTNTARSVYDPTVFAKIKDIFKETYKRLKKTRNLASIFIKLDNNKK